MCAVIDVARSALLCARAGHVGKAEEEEEPLTKESTVVAVCLSFDWSQERPITRSCLKRISFVFLVFSTTQL